MHSLKVFILKAFGLLVAALGRLTLVGAALVVGAQGLAFVDHVERYAFLKNFLVVERRLEAPAVKVLHANLPCVYGGIDLAPYAIGLVLIVAWILCESELHRLRVTQWRLSEEKKLAERKREMSRDLKRIEKERAEANRRIAKEAATAPAPKPAAARAVEGETEREKLLELYAQTKKSLEEQKKNLSFLAIDVVNSTGMKQGEDQALAERDFRQYKKLVERIIAAHKGLKAAWTPDGVMICFASVQSAVQAAQELIRSLEHFNRSIKTIKADFKVRCGINAGNVLFDESVRMEEMTDRNIDIAGHMQKYADANTIYVGAHAIEGIRAQFDFRPAEKEVDGHEVYAWRGDAADA